MKKFPSRVKTLKDLKKDAQRLFLNGEYRGAIALYTEVLQKEPYDLEAKVCLMISDMALDDETGAQTLYELYQNALKHQIEHLDTAFEALLKEGGVVVDAVGSELTFEDLMREGLEEYITYKEFQTFVRGRDSFKRAFEDLIFSGKIVIDTKEDFIEFISKLLENGFTNTAFNYLESAIELYPHESFFQKKMGQIEGSG